MPHTEVENLFFYQINKLISVEVSACIQFLERGDRKYWRFTCTEMKFNHLYLNVSLVLLNGSYNANRKKGISCSGGNLSQMIFFLHMYVQFKITCVNFFWLQVIALLLKSNLLISSGKKFLLCHVAYLCYYILSFHLRKKESFDNTFIQQKKPRPFEVQIDQY